MSRRLLCAAPAVLLCAALAPWLAAEPKPQVVVKPAAPVWEALGPAPIANGSYAGRVSAIAASRIDSGRYFAGGADGGVWATADGGATWTCLTEAAATSAIGALAIDPTNELIVYAGTGEANFANHSRYGLGILKSEDGGGSWRLFGAGTFAGRCISRIVIDPSAPATLYAAVTRAGGFPEMAAAKGHPGAGGPRGVFKSLDGGQTWTQLGGGLPVLDVTDLAMDPVDPSHLYAAVGRIFGSGQNGIYKTTNGGASWSKLTAGLPASSIMGRISLAVAPSDRNRLYALVTRRADAAGGSATTEGAYRSSDAGASWTGFSVGALQSSYGWYLSTVVVHPTQPDTVLLGGVSLVRSTNAGASYTTVTPPHVDMHALAYDKNGRLLAGGDGGVHRSTNNGSSWVSLNAGLSTIQFYAGLSSHPADDDVFYGGTQDNGTNKRDGAGLEWQQVFGGDGGWTQLDPANPAVVFVEYQGAGNLYKSTNGGASFSWSGSGISTADRTAFLPPYLIDPAQPSRMLYATHRVYRSLNGGASWSALSGDLSNGAGAIRTLALSPADANVVWAATNDGNVQVSVNGGATFTKVLTGIPGWPRTTREIFPDRSDSGTAWLAVAAFGQVQIQKTTDLGQSWTPKDLALDDVPVNVVAVLPDPRPGRAQIFAGTDFGLLWSPDGGASFRPYGTGLPVAAVIDLLLEPERGRIVAATQGRGAFRARLLPAKR